MSEKVFDNYIENAFGNEGQADFKKAEFIFNYQKYFPKDLNSKIVDIGVGRGEMLSCLKEQGFKNYIGIDISPSTISFCKKLNLNCEHVEDSKRWLEERPNSLSLITLLDVLEHFDLDFALEFLKSAHRALSNDGVFIIQVPNMQAPDGHLHFYNDVTHKMGFLEHSLEQLFITAGIKNFEIYGYENIVGSGPKSLIKKILRALLRKWTRFSRTLHGNLNPEILTPVFYAVVRK